MLDAIILQIHTPMGVVFTPIHFRLSSICRSFYKRGEDDRGYLLAEIYVVMVATGFRAMFQRAGSFVLNALHGQLREEGFASTLTGQFTRLATYVQREVRILIQGENILPQPKDQTGLQAAIVENIHPHAVEGHLYPGYYWLELSLTTFGNYTIMRMGSAHDLLRLIESE